MEDNFEIVTKVEEIIPQRKPVVMIGQLIFSTEKEAVTNFLVTADNIFVTDNRFTESGILENIAQTAAAMVGYNFRKLKKEVPPGFIGSIRNLEINYFPKVGETITTKIELQNEVFGVSVVGGEIFCNGQSIAKGEYKIFVMTEQK